MEVAKNQISVPMFLATNKHAWRLQMVDRVRHQANVLLVVIAHLINVSLFTLSGVTLTTLLRVYANVIVQFLLVHFV